MSTLDNLLITTSACYDLDQFSRFCTAHPSAQHTIRQTRRQPTFFLEGRSNSPHLALAMRPNASSMLSFVQRRQVYCSERSTLIWVGAGGLHAQENFR